MPIVRALTMLAVLLSALLCGGCGGGSPVEPPHGWQAGRLPAIEPDYAAIVVDEAATWAEIERAITAAGAGDLESLEPLDVYRGKQVPPGKKSVALRFQIRSKTGTLTHEKADEVQTRLLEALKASLGAVLRG